MSPTRAEAILIVEDDEGVAILERRALERRGFDVVSVPTLAAAIAAVSSQPFDLIVADYRLKNETGLELFEQLQARGYAVPIIMVTGFSNEETVIEAIRRGVRDFVPKSAEYLHYLPDAVERVLTSVRTERQLAESEARFRSVTESASDGIVAIDAQGQIISWNSGATRIFGYSAEEALGTGITSLMPLEYRERHTMACRRAAQTGQTSLLGKPIELEGLRNDGTRFPIEVSLSAWTERGETFFCGIIRDISDRKRTEEALRQRDDQLRQAQKMEAVGTLAGGVAHEFNNLLQAVLGYTRFAMSSIGEGHPAQADLQIVVSAAERAALLTQQLLSFSRREPGELVPLDVNVAIHELVAMLRPLIGEQIAIELALDEGLGMISADPVQVQQMLMNLCINARDAMPQGGKITISSRDLMIDEVDSMTPVPRAGRYLALSVSDTGCGMSPEVKQKIFEPFFTTKPVGKGTGLGLAMVYSSVQHHAGGILVESEEGIGTRFTIYLPLTATPSIPQDTAQASAARSGSETILIAEDEPLVLDLARRMLEGAGYRILTAVDGRDALRLFKENKDHIDLVILDAVMPQLSGWEAIREIRRIRPSIPAIFSTGYDPQRAPTLPDGVAPRFIQKPFSLDHLLEVVRETLEEAYVCPHP